MIQQDHTSLPRHLCFTNSTCLVNNPRPHPSCITFELKPKWGYLPKSPFLSPLSANIKSRFCRFCMHQQLKLHNLDDADSSKLQESLFCPLDLFSGKYDRILKSVSALFQTPRNNLRLFVHDETHGTKSVSPQEAEVLRRNICLFMNLPESSVNATDSLIELLSTALASEKISSFFSRIQCIQQEFDFLDIEGNDLDLLLLTTDCL